MTRPTIMLGTHTIGDAKEMPGIVHFDTPGEVSELLNTFRARGFRDLDTSRNYPKSEERMGEVEIGNRFTIHTKVWGIGPGVHTDENLQSSIDASLSELKLKQVETLYLHSPDRATPVLNVARKINDIFRQGKFQHFGLSNYRADEVQEWLKICEENNFVKPTVYQGQYNFLVRGAETALLPILREHGVGFTAYSPAAGGFLAETPSSTKRWSEDNVIGKLYKAMYQEPSLVAAKTRVQELCKSHNISGHTAALRWTIYHSMLDGSKGDSVIFAVSNMDQLQKTMDAIDAGKLPTELAAALSEVYDKLNGKGPAYHPEEAIMKLFS